MMYTVVIVDDEEDARSLLKRMLTKYCSDSIQVLAEADGVSSAKNILSNFSPDIVFLDIKMKDGTGFTLLDQLEKRDFRLIFTTAYDEFALKAFKYNALDYLLKPIDPTELTETVSKVIQYGKISNEQINNLPYFSKKESFKKIGLTTTDGILFVNLEEIIHLESDGNYTSVYCVDKKKIVIAKTLGEYSKLLPDNIFFRVHQSHLVNINFIHLYRNINGGEVVLNNEKSIPVARRKKIELLNILKLK